MKPYGGTEIQLEYLHKYVDKDLLNKVQITTSVPEKTPIDPTKINVLWVHNSYDQPNLYPWFKNKTTGEVYDSIAEFNADVANPSTPTKAEDLQRDVQITVASLQVFGKTK